MGLRDDDDKSFFKSWWALPIRLWLYETGYKEKGEELNLVKYRE